MAKEVSYTCDRCGAPATERRSVYKYRVPDERTAAYDLVIYDYCDRCAAEFDGAATEKEDA